MKQKNAPRVSQHTVGLFTKLLHLRCEPVPAAERNDVPKMPAAGRESRKQVPFLRDLRNQKPLRFDDSQLNQMEDGQAEFVNHEFLQLFGKTGGVCRFQ